MGLNKIKAY